MQFLGRLFVWLFQYKEVCLQKLSSIDKIYFILIITGRNHLNFVEKLQNTTLCTSSLSFGMATFKPEEAVHRGVLSAVVIHKLSLSMTMQNDCIGERNMRGKLGSKIAIRLEGGRQKLGGSREHISGIEELYLAYYNAQKTCCRHHLKTPEDEKDSGHNNKIDHNYK